jgi:hypothetical protein
VASAGLVPSFCPKTTVCTQKARKKHAVQHGIPVNEALTKLLEIAPMKRLIPLIFLAACGAQPTPMMMGAERIEVTRNGRQYVVFKKEKSVEIIRLGYAKRNEFQGIREDMIALIPEVTGCKLLETSLQGDSGEMRGKISC